MIDSWHSGFWMLELPFSYHVDGWQNPGLIRRLQPWYVGTLPPKKSHKNSRFCLFFFLGGVQIGFTTPKKKIQLWQIWQKEGGVFQHPWVPKLHKVSQHIYWAWFSLQPHARFSAFWVRELPSVPMILERPESYADVFSFNFFRFWGLWCGISFCVENEDRRVVCSYLLLLWSFCHTHTHKETEK